MRFAAGVLPFHNQLVLLGLEPRGWSAFAGTDEPHETVYETATRELREETAGLLDVAVELRSCGVVQLETPSRRPCFIFLVPIAPACARPEDFDARRRRARRRYMREKQCVRWVAREDVPSLPLAPAFRRDWPALLGALPPPGGERLLPPGC